MTVRDVPVTIELLVRRLIQGRTAPFAATVGLAKGQTEVVLNGAVTEIDSDPKFKGKLEVTSQNLGETAKAVLGSAAPTLPGFTAQSFELGIDTLFAGADGLTAQDIKLALGATKATGGITLDLGDAIDFTADLAIGQVDLDQWLAMPALAATQAAIPPRPEPKDRAQLGNSDDARVILAATSEGVSEAAAALIPANIAGSISAEVDAITFKGGVVQDVQLSAEVGNSEVTISQASARLPGSTDVAAFGFLNGAGAVPSFEGEIEANASNLRGILAWLEIPDDTLPADRLRALSFRSQVTGNPEQVQLAGINLKFDSSQLNGGVTLAIRDRLAFGANLALDSIDLDAYLPTQTASTPAGDPAAAPQTPDETTAGGTTPEKSANPLDALKVLATFDANVRAAVGRVIYQGEQIRDIGLDASLFNGALDVKSLSVKNAAGASLAVRGGLEDLATGPKMRDLRADVGIASLSKISKVLALDLPKEAQGLGKVSLSVTGNGPVFKPRLASTLKAAGATLRVSGSATMLPAPGFNGQVSVKHGDLQRLIRTLKLDMRPQGPLGPLDVSAKIAASPTTIAVDDLKGTIAGTALNGKTTVQLAGTKPDISATVALGALNVDAFLEKPAASQTRTARSGGQQGSAGAQGSPLGPEGGQWPTDPIDLSGLNAVNANVAVTAESITYDRMVLKNADVALTLKDGLLQTQRLGGQLFGGKVDGGLTVTAEPVSADIKVGVDGLQIGQALQAVTGKGVASGRFGLNLDIKGRGANTRDLISSLSGQGAFSANRLDVQGAAQGSVLAPFIGLVGGINQLASVVGGRQGQGLADVTGSFSMTNGVGTTNDLKVNSAYGVGQAAGTINLPSWTVDLNGQMNLAQNVLAGLIARAANISSDTRLPFSVKGPLDAPNVKVDTAALGGGTGLPIPGAEKLIDKDSKAGRILNQVLPGLLGGGASRSQQGNQGTQGTPNQAPQYGEPGSPPPPGGSSTDQQQRQVTPEDILRGVLGF